MAASSRTRRTASSICLAVFALLSAGCGAVVVPLHPSTAAPTPSLSSSPSPSPQVSLTPWPTTSPDIAAVDKATADPTKTPTAGPSLPPLKPPESFWLDTSVVGNFAEPPAAGRDHTGKFYSNHNYWAFCGAGSARVALEFAGKNPNWIGGRWPLTEYIEPWTSATGARTKWKDGEPSDQGRGYMMYLAMQVKPPSFRVPGVVTFGMEIDATGASVVGSYGTQVATVLNWEASGHKAEKGYFVAQNSNVSEATFYRDLEREVALGGYPALVSVLTAGYWAQKTRWTLPNWDNHGIPHWIAVVGYDRDNFYYIDTCWRSTACGLRDPVLTGPHPGTWAIPRYTLYEAMVSGYGGYIAPNVK